MSCWRILPLDNPSNHHVPQLLIKSNFNSNHYTVFITDLSNIWSEELDLNGILERVSQQKSPIEVSKHDTTQLAILLENVAKSLTHGDDTLCRITRDDAGDVILHTSTRLPAPLDSLHWRFRLEKQNTSTLKNELILPLLVSAHIQHERVKSLAAIVHEKDRAITRLVDHYESSHLDLASAFPSIGGSKSGRKIVKREQAARHIPALRNFEEEQWKVETSQLQDGEVCELGLFQEALSECNPKVPSHMAAKNQSNPWWSSIPSVLEVSTSFKNPGKRPTSPNKHSAEAEEDETETETETEDEFETHEHFKSREISRNSLKAQIDPIARSHDLPLRTKDTTEKEDEDEDLNVLSLSQSHSQSIARKLPSRTKSPEPDSVSSSSTSPAKPIPPISSRGKGFKIGGAKTVKANMTTDVQIDTDGNQTQPTAAITKLPKKGFAIGGKRKAGLGDQEANSAVISSPMEPEATRTHQPTTGRNVSSPHTPPTENKTIPMEDIEREETAEEKAERKRRELKRKNEELAKKQAQKKKKRF